MASHSRTAVASEAKPVAMMTWSIGAPAAGADDASTLLVTARPSRVLGYSGVRYTTVTYGYQRSVGGGRSPPWLSRWTALSSTSTKPTMRSTGYFLPWVSTSRAPSSA